MPVRSPRLLIAVIAPAWLIAGPAHASQTAPDIVPVTPTIIREYRVPIPDLSALFAQMGQPVPTRLPYINVRAGAIEPKSGSLWVVFPVESPGVPPVRIDRRTGEGRVMDSVPGRPFGYVRPMAVVPGARGDVGVWDRGTLQMIWFDDARRSASVWKVNFANWDFRHTYTDSAGHLFFGQGGRFCTYEPPNYVRIDSVRGAVDPVNVPAAPYPGTVWGWQQLSANGAGGGSCGGHNPLWAIDWHGRVNIAYDDSSVVIVKTATGDRRMLLPEYHEQIPESEREFTRRLNERTDYARREPGREVVGTPPPVPLERRQIEEIFPDMNGGIVLARSRACASVPGWPKFPLTAAPSDTSSRCRIFERFDTDGTRRTPFTVANRDLVLAIRGDTVWISREGRDQSTIVLETIVRGR